MRTASFRSVPSNAAQFQDIGATLYFVNVPLPALTDSLADFLGAPRRKVLASLFFTPAGGGAVPHFDKNENFTIQLTGAKRWQVGETPMVPRAPDSYTLGSSVIMPALAPLLAEAQRPPERTVDLKPGTLLYVPRGTVHHTGAGEPSWSLNLSYCPAMWLDLLQVGLQAAAGRVAALARHRDRRGRRSRRARRQPPARTAGGIACAAGRSRGSRGAYPLIPRPARWVRAMRLLMRVVLPAEAPVLAAPDFEAQWRALLKRIGALASYPREQGRLQYVLVEADPSQITPIAEAVFRLVGVKPEFLPEIVPQPYYGVRNY